MLIFDVPAFPMMLIPIAAIVLAVVCAIGLIFLAIFLVRKSNEKSRNEKTEYTSEELKDDIKE